MISFNSMIKHLSPFEWFLHESPINSKLHLKLSTSFPLDKFETCENVSSVKPYKMELFKVYKQEQYDNTITLPNNDWQNFIRYIVSNDYRLSLENYINKELSTCQIEVNIWGYPNSGFLAPHIDKDKKFVTQLFYFNTKWEDNWGGSLRILNSNNINDFGHEIFPNTKDSIILTQSNNSWHAVTRQRGPQDIVRKVVQLIFWES